jgi:hypothetical protein
MFKINDVNPSETVFKDSIHVKCAIVSFANMKKTVTLTAIQLSDMNTFPVSPVTVSCLYTRGQNMEENSINTGTFF